MVSGHMGLQVYKPDKAYNGFTLFAIIFPTVPNQSDVWLIDMHGRFVHRWQLGGRIKYHAELLPTGNLLFGLLDTEVPPVLPIFASGLVVEMDWDGNVVWRHRESWMDAHDRDRMKNGNTLIHKYEQVPEHIAAKVKGGVPGTEQVWGGLTQVPGFEAQIPGMMGNVLQEITPKGKVAWEWRAYEHLDPKLDAITPENPRFIWPGWNAIVELPDGNIMACAFNTSNIIIIDKATGDLKWRWGQGIISFPHDPSMLDNGNILLLDNRKCPMFWAIGSRVMEVNPETNEIEWEYSDEDPANFWTPYAGGVQRLPNGNTLICSALQGRLFEVTPSGEIVWEYIVPFYGRDNEGFAGLNHAVFRCYRYSPDYPGLQGKRLDAEKLDMWNRLYGPEALGVLGGRVVVGRGIETPTVQEEAVPQPRYEEAAPSVGRPSKESKFTRRITRLGY